MADGESPHSCQGKHACKEMYVLDQSRALGPHTNAKCIRLPGAEGPALPISGIITGAGRGAVVRVSRMPRPSIIAYEQAAAACKQWKHDGCCFVNYASTIWW